MPLNKDTENPYSTSIKELLAEAFPLDEDALIDEPRRVATKLVKAGYTQWTTGDKTDFIPSGYSVVKLIPGIYSVFFSSSRGYYFKKQTVLTKDILRFPQTKCDEIVSEIERFWDKEHLFNEYKLPYQRGILLYGIQGGGKSSIISLVIQDVINRGGIVIKFLNPDYFTEGMQILRQIEPNTPIVVLMEDIDATIAKYNESDVLNILDGVNQIDKVVYLATTNYPEVLGQRILNRPSRFDKRFRIDLPNEESRRMYLEFLIGKEKIKELNIDLEKWIEDTEEFTLAHIKELFVAVVILENSYDSALDTLNEMRNTVPSSAQDIKKSGGLGFGGSSKTRKRCT